MAITFPRTDILDGLQFSAETQPFKPMWRQERSRTAGGVTLVKSVGPMLWQANYVTVPMTTARAGEVEADLMSLQGGVHLFEGYDPRHPLPASDKVSALSGVEVYAVIGDREGITLANLPSGFVITRGDWISIDDGTNLHLLKVLETQTANAFDRLYDLAVAPYVHPSIDVGQQVTLRYPCARWMIEADTVQRTPRGALHEVISFSATQVIV